MNDEAESSRAGQRYDADASNTDAEAASHDVVVDEEEAARAREQTVKERRVDAKRKRVLYLDHLLRELDGFVYLELITIYYVDCSFFWFAIRSIIHGTLLTPLPDLALARQHEEHKPFMPLILFSFAINFFLHLLYSAPSAGEDTRGYLHGGLMIDFIGQQGPTSKWRLAFLDIAVMAMQLVMVSVYVKRRDLKKKLSKMAGGSSTTRSTEGDTAEPAGEAPAQETNAERDQDADAEERGMLRRTDTLSDLGADPDEEDVLLPASSETGHVDAFDILASGQCLIGDFHVIETLRQEHDDYQTYRQTRTDTAGSSLPPNALRQLNTFRVRFGVGGG
ncbi:hypothetical protein BDV96DRAFT_615265 [Lophiotrema nucula]|uniref:DUF1746 domain-containing protein n=1 Tax=Lophiotrema nucula TaxID=690887 RepID=A0A6A5YU45_9PLEO|nr:hypothetical protein BDV96DRAFT_615265 [Lophiotrema nucula]